MAKQRPTDPRPPGESSPNRGGVRVPVRLSFRYSVAGSAFCLSRAGRDEVRAAPDCLRKLTTLTRLQVLSQGGKGANKTGLAWTVYDAAALRGAGRPPELPSGVRIGAVRAGQKSRVFGAHDAGVFYMLFFDPDHQIVPT